MVMRVLVSACNTLVLADAINGIAIGSLRANHADSIAMGNGSQTTVVRRPTYTCLQHGRTAELCG